MRLVCAVKIRAEVPPPWRQRMVGSEGGGCRADGGGLSGMVTLGRGRGGW